MPDEASKSRMDQIGANVAVLRAELRAASANVVAKLPAHESRVSGEFFVESFGTTVRIDQGECEHVYVPDALTMRDHRLEAQSASRSAFFGAIAAQFPSGSQVLNIGAGGDAAPIKSMVGAGHDVVSTDMSEETVEITRARSGAPAFACDLIHLGRVLPSPFDYVIGNSTLAYVDPTKLKTVVQNVASAMTRGGVFSFDLMPHGHYFIMAESKLRQTVANESAPDPYRLLEYIGKYGAADGLNAMALHSYYQGLSVNMAMVSMLRGLFENEGVQCATGIAYLEETTGGRATCLVLRVAKSDANILKPIGGETPYDDPSDALVSFARDDQSKVWFSLAFIDRTSGALLADAFGIQGTKRSKPWLVAQHAAQTQDVGALSEQIRQEVLAEIDPVRLRERILPFVHGQPFNKPQPLPPAVAADQVIHKFVITGEMSLSFEQADDRIDQQYAGEEAKSREKADQKRAAHVDEERRLKRKKAKAMRQRQRKK